MALILAQAASTAASAAAGDGYTVKAVPGTIWNNAYGAEEEINSDPKASEADKAALSYGYTQFKGKKGDFRGYYLRLKKKK